MRVDALHRRIVRDVHRMHEAVAESFPIHFPTRYESLNLSPFLDRLNFTTDPLGLCNELTPDASILPGQIKVTGLWIDKSELPENSSRADIRVLWHVHPDTKRLDLTPLIWNRRRYFFWQTYMHELVHRYQRVLRPEATQCVRVYRPRSTERTEREEQEYYGNYDEIEAHSHDAVIEMLTWWGHLSLRDAIHEAKTYSGRVIRPTYQFYHDTFSIPHPAMQHFRRKVRAWYDVMTKNSEVYELIQLPNLVI